MTITVTVMQALQLRSQCLSTSPGHSLTLIKMEHREFHYATSQAGFPGFLLMCLLICTSNGFPQDKINVLFIVADDLRPALGSYGNTVVQTPNLDKLAQRSIRFTTAASQQAVCAPSRISFLTSRRPDTTKLLGNKGALYWRVNAGNFTSLPQHFKDAGYLTASAGKVFHPGRASNFTDDYPYSWSIPPYHASTHAYKNAAVCPGADGKLHINIVCPVDIEKQPEKTLPDIQSTQFALNFLKNYTISNNSNQPFFLAVGYHKPHIPLKFPKQFLDLYPIEKIRVAADPLLPYHLPPVAYEPWTDLRWRDDIAALNLSFPYERMPDFYAKKILQSYYAATTYMDSLVGQLLIALDEYGLASNTIVSFTGDHGWALGEHQEWSKFSNFRVATNVPLMIHVPGVTDNRDHGGSGTVSDALVELVDLFPTLAELAALKVPDLCPDDSSNITLCSEGLSFAPLLKNLSLPWKKAIFSQYPRPSDEPQENTCEPLPSEVTIMGYSMQTSRYHYTEWIQYDHKTQKGNWSNLHARELYIDPRDDRNVAFLPYFSDLVQELSIQLRKGWRNALPENNYVHA